MCIYYLGNQRAIFVLDYVLNIKKKKKESPLLFSDQLILDTAAYRYSAGCFHICRIIGAEKGGKMNR